MARIGMKVTIVAKDDPTKPDGVDFHMEDKDGKQIDTLTFRKGDFQGMKKSDEHEVSFDLRQDEGMTLEFAHSLDDVLWVAMGDRTNTPACPKTKPAQGSDIFYASKSTPKKLIAVNTNPAEQLFSFTVNFTDRAHQGPKKLIPFDPPGSNHDGGITGIDPGISSNVIIGAVAAVAILAVAFFAFR